MVSAIFFWKSYWTKSTRGVSGIFGQINSCSCTTANVAIDFFKKNIQYLLLGTHFHMDVCVTGKDNLFKKKIHITELNSLVLPFLFLEWYI